MCSCAASWLEGKGTFSQVPRFCGCVPKRDRRQQSLTREIRVLLHFDPFPWQHDRQEFHGSERRDEGAPLCFLPGPQPQMIILFFIHGAEGSGSGPPQNYSNFTSEEEERALQTRTLKLPCWGATEPSEDLQIPPGTNLRSSRLNIKHRLLAAVGRTFSCPGNPKERHISL